MGIVVKGDRVLFATRADAPLQPTRDCLRLPARYGIIHDPDGTDLRRCTVYFGPYRTIGGKPTLTRAARAYFGPHYAAKPIAVNPPGDDARWTSVAPVYVIFYRRKGFRAGGYHHPFRRAPLTLEKSGPFYRLYLPGTCIVDDRGFVFP
jgi:hypothetical protein